MNSSLTHVVVALILKDNLICVGQRKKEPFKGFFECPGGKVEPRESLEEALQRELYEEGEMTLQSAQYMTFYDVANDHGYFRLHWFKVEPKTPFKPIIYDEVLWVQLQDLPQLNWIEHNRPYLPLLMNVQQLMTETYHFEYSHSDLSKLLNDLELCFKQPSSLKKSVTLSLGNTPLNSCDPSLLDFIQLYPITLLP